MTHSETYLRETADLASKLDFWKLEQMADLLSKCVGRVYVIGLGGSLANAIHMAADLRKLCNLDAEAFDNIAELTARANDEGLHTIFHGWLSRMTDEDILFVLSVGGGTGVVSTSIGEAINEAKRKQAMIMGIVGPVGGMTSAFGDIVLKIPATERITPHTEAFQAVAWHCLVSHPTLQKNATKW